MQTNRRTAIPPPPSSSPIAFYHPGFPTASRAGLLRPYLNKLEIEDLDLHDFDNSGLVGPADGDRFRNCSAHEVVKKFLKQVRETGGYDVDCVPPKKMHSCFFPINLDRLKAKDKWHFDLLVDTAEFAIEEINRQISNYKAIRKYKLHGIVRAVETLALMDFLTITAKEDGGPEHTFRAIVYTPPGRDWAKLRSLEEWRFKPVGAAAASASNDGWLMWDGNDFVPAPSPIPASIGGLIMWDGNDFVLFPSPTPST